MNDLDEHECESMSPEEDFLYPYSKGYFCLMLRLRATAIATRPKPVFNRSLEVKRSPLRGSVQIMRPPISNQVLMLLQS